ncbi:MAG: ABC transporter permease [Lachnospiraceae bacterium]|nr:ABC transporter permease [Lachnospiraceae bacterium]
MHLWALLQSTFLQIYSRKKAFFVTLLLLVVSFLVVDYALMILVPVCGSKAIFSQTLSRDSGDIYCLNMWKYFFPGYYAQEDIYSLLQDIQGLEQVEGAGVYFYTNTERITAEDSDLLVISPELLSMTKLRDTTGSGIDLSSQEGSHPAAVGYALRDRYPVGSVIHDIQQETDYVVKYILEKDCRFLGEDIGSGLCASLDERIVVGASAYLEEYMFALDYAISQNSLCFFVSPKADIAGIEPQIYQCAAAYGLDIYNIKSFSEKADMSFGDIWQEKEQFVMPLLLLIMAVVATIVSSMIEIYTRKRTIGILYATGYFKKDIKRMYIMENVIKLGIAFSVAIAYWNTQRDFFAQDSAYFVLRQVFVVSLALTLVMLVVGSIFPLRQLDKLPVAQIVMEESE